MWEIVIVAVVIVAVASFMLGLWFYIMAGEPQNPDAAADPSTRCAQCVRWNTAWCLLSPWGKVAQAGFYGPVMLTCKVMNCSFNECSN